MNIKKLLILLSIISITTLNVVGCKHEGPAETAGKKVDHTAKDVGNAIEDACEKAKKEAGAEDTDC